MRKLEKLLSPIKVPKIAQTGDAGYDNARENIDPQVKTQVVHAREIVLGGVRRATWPTSAGHTIEDEGVVLDQRDTINFVGAGVTAADAGGKTVVTIAGGGAVDSVFTRTGAVVAASNDYTWAQINKTTSDIANITTKSHTSLSDIGTNTHAQIDTHIGAANPHSGSAASGANSDITSITGLTTDLTVAQGGTGQSTEQAAINALSAVSGATNEHVLTKDTATGNAIFKVATLAHGKIWIGDAGGTAQEITLSGDLTTTNAGVVSVSDLTITSEAQGDVLYNNGTNWVRLAPGTSGQFLKTQGAAANPVWTAVPTPALSLVETITLTEAGTTFDFTGLDINTDGKYMILFEIQNNTASDALLYLYVNNDTTTTNYYSQYFRANNASLGSGRANNAQIAFYYASKEAFGEIKISLTPNNYVHAIMHQLDNRGSAISKFDIVLTKVATVANITQLTFVGTQVLAIGSKVSLYKIGD